jgi:hypothetical protein
MTEAEDRLIVAALKWWMGRPELNELSNGKFIHAFGRLWDSTNAKRGYPWESNPWVWAISFEPSPKQEGTP